MKVNIDADTLHLLKEAVASDDREWIVCVEDDKGEVHTQSNCTPVFFQMCAKELQDTAEEQMKDMSEDDIESMMAGFLMKTINQALKGKGKDDESNQIHHTAGK